MKIQWFVIYSRFQSIQRNISHLWKKENHFPNDLGRGYLSLNPSIFSLSLIRLFPRCHQSYCHSIDHPPQQKPPKTCLVLAPLGGNAAFRCNAAGDTSRQLRIGFIVSSGMSKRLNSTGQTGPKRGCIWHGFSDSPRCFFGQWFGWRLQWGICV